MRIILFFTMLLATSLLPNTVWSQSLGRIEGKIVDFDGEPIPLASVEAYQNGNLRGESKSDFHGHYKFHLIPGIYLLKVKRVGYNQMNSDSITVTANKILLKNITLDNCTGRRGNGFIFCNKCGIKSKAAFNCENDTMKVSWLENHDCISLKPNISMARIVNTKGHGINARIDFYHKKELIRTVRSNSKGFFYFENKKKKKLRLKIFAFDYEDKCFQSRVKRGDELIIELERNPTPSKNQ